jgi:SAM-dependent methyltransferase
MKARGVRRVPVIEAMGEEYEEAFDLIYLLSVYRHLPPQMIEANLARVSELLKSNGVLVFSMHGIIVGIALMKEAAAIEFGRPGGPYKRRQAETRRRRNLPAGKRQRRRVTRPPGNTTGPRLRSLQRA